MPDMKITPKEVLEGFSDALMNNDIRPYYQPQYKLSTGFITGAEALARWIDRDRGVIPPIDFIPVLEEKNLITQLDLHIFECVCRFLSLCHSTGKPMLPISANVSRKDIQHPGFAAQLDGIRQRYDVPVKYIHIEITESAAAGDVELVNRFVSELHAMGYIVAMDDFGTGYSSLNVLKDLDFDVLKLDMGFLKGCTASGNKGGAVLSSVIRMAKWLELPVVAEGVETQENAAYLQSIGCEYVQGYLYSRPVQEAEYVSKIIDTKSSDFRSDMHVISTLHTADFWNPESLETLIFSNFVGGAAIFFYRDGQVEIVRVNEKYTSEIGMNNTSEEIIEGDFWKSFDEYNRQIYTDALNRAVKSNREEECETRRIYSSECCGNQELYIRTNMRVIGSNGNEYLFYAMIRNITAEKHVINELRNYENSFKRVTEQVNIYYWEYTISTKEMRPCFRCMRDLGLPPLVRNYPEPAIEQGIFPPDYADMYREWHKKLAEGVSELEAVIPLTVGRVPFRVKYVNSYDENGRPLKAYGSATLVVE